MSPRAQRIALACLIIPAGVAIWGGWVGLGRLSGFGPVPLLPGIWDDLVVDLAITLPVSVEAYAALALGIWLGRIGSLRARHFARVSALAAMVLGGAGQVAYHLLMAAGQTAAPVPVIILVSVLPVITLTAAAALLHLLPEEESATAVAQEEVEVDAPEEKPFPEVEELREKPAAALPPPAILPTPEPASGSKRERIEAILRTDSGATTSAIAQQVGCAPRYVRDIRNA